MSTSQMTPVTQSFDAEAFRRGIEERDAAMLLGQYAEDAELQVVDRNDQPSHPRTIRGRAAIGEYLADVCGRDMIITTKHTSVGSSKPGVQLICHRTCSSP